MAPKWITGLLILHASLVFCDAQFCDGIADNFTTPVNIREAVESTLTLLPTSFDGDLYFRDWIFPNSLKFPCRGLLDGWIFRAKNNTNLIELINFPQWGVYTKSTGTSQLSYNLKRSGSFTGLSKIADGVYQYSLQSPLQVEEGDIVGVQYLDFPDVTNSLLLSFIDGGSGAGGPVSYRHQFTGELFIIPDDGGFVINDTRYTPLVTAVMNVSGPSLNVFSPTPSPTTPSPTTPSPTTPSPTTPSPTTPSPTIQALPSRTGFIETTTTILQPMTGVTEAAATTVSQPLFGVGGIAGMAVMGVVATTVVLILLLVSIVIIRKKAFTTNQGNFELSQKKSVITDGIVNISSNEAYIHSESLDDLLEYKVPTNPNPAVPTGSNPSYISTCVPQSSYDLHVYEVPKPAVPTSNNQDYTAPSVPQLSVEVPPTPIQVIDNEAYGSRGDALNRSTNFTTLANEKQQEIMVSVNEAYGSRAPLDGSTNFTTLVNEKQQEVIVLQNEAYGARADVSGINDPAYEDVGNINRVA